MELSGYELSKLKSLLIACTAGIIDSKESCPELATDLKFWEGEIKCAISDRQLKRVLKIERL